MKMNKVSVAGLLAGLLLLAALLVWQGLTPVLELLANTGWILLWLPLAWLPSLLLTSESWRLLLYPETSVRFLPTLLASWMGHAVNTLLPCATIGGEIVKARYLSLRGADPERAAASVMVDKTVQVVAVMVWGMIGIGVLFSTQQQTALGFAFLGAFAVLGISTVMFFYVQKMGFFSLLSRLAHLFVSKKTWEGLPLNAATMDHQVMHIYRRPMRILAASVGKSLGLALQTAEVWLACLLLGHPIGLVEAILLKSLTATASDIAFLIPNGYGIQEGAYILVGAILGMSPEFALSLSLSVRLRELLIDVPGLLLWQHVEGQALLGRLPEP